MSQRFHINKNGVPAVCKAKPGNCPLGGDESHYNSEVEAQTAADEIGESKHGLLPEQDAGLLSQATDIPTDAKNRIEEITENHRDSFREIEDYHQSLGSTDKGEIDGKLEEKLENMIYHYEELSMNKSSGVELKDKYKIEELNKDDYEETVMDYYDGPVDSKWTDKSEEVYLRDLKKNEDKLDYYQSKAEIIDDIVKDAKNNDWEAHGMSNDEGVLHTLNHVYKDGMFSEEYST